MKKRKINLKITSKKVKELKGGQSLLLQALWQKHGGITEVSKKTKVPRQQLVNWKLRGRVPLEQVGRVSRGLNILKEGLNYDQIFDFNGYGSSWKWVVEQYGFDKAIEKKILAGKNPEKAKYALP